MVPSRGPIRLDQPTINLLVRFQALGATWAAYARLFPTPLSKVGQAITFEKTPYGGLRGFAKMKTAASLAAKSPSSTSLRTLSTISLVNSTAWRASLHISLG